MASGREDRSYYWNEIHRWERDGQVWTWTNERDADTRTMQTFLALEVGRGAVPEDLLTACRLAYDALAFPNDTLCADGTSYVYDLARDIANYRHDFARTIATLSRCPRGDGATKLANESREIEEDGAGPSTDEDDFMAELEMKGNDNNE